jgi:hypothetical protein
LGVAGRSVFIRHSSPRTPLFASTAAATPDAAMDRAHQESQSALGADRGARNFAVHGLARSVDERASTRHSSVFESRSLRRLVALRARSSRRRRELRQGARGRRQ